MNHWQKASDFKGKSYQLGDVFLIVFEGAEATMDVVRLGEYGLMKPLRSTIALTSISHYMKLNIPQDLAPMTEFKL